MIKQLERMDKRERESQLYYAGIFVTRPTETCALLCLCCTKLSLFCRVCFPTSSHCTSRGKWIAVHDLAEITFKAYFTLMASLFPLIRFVSGEIILVTLWAALLLVAWHIWDWSPALLNANGREMLSMPHCSLPLSTSGAWVMQGRRAIVSMAIDLALGEERNLSFILILSDFVW